MDGRTTRWGRVFRSDTLHELTRADLTVLRELGLASVIDLRTVAEIERSGRGLLRSEPVHYVNLSVLPEEGGERGEQGGQGSQRGQAGGGRDGEQSEAGEQLAMPAARLADIAERYLSYLEVGSSALFESFCLIADPASYPLVFHCQAGKDRTGVLAALVLGCVGVERNAIVDDYVLTETRMDLIIGRLRRDPHFADRMDELPPSVFKVEAETMQRFLDGVDRLYGGPRAWALSAGVTESQLDTLADLLVEDPYSRALP